ncbi:MAG: multi-sensor hybrid histidine kinase [Bacteroidetes bacterium]|nr:multi-sensor hybrid histidine kinase [Bacteroidota bacterium]
MDADLQERLKTLETETDPKFLRELVDMYLVSASKSMEDIMSGHKERNAKKLHVAAHTLKGSSGNVGARSLAAACTMIEEATGSSVGNEIGGFVEKVQAEYERVRTDLLAFLAQGKRDGST